MGIPQASACTSGRLLVSRKRRRHDGTRDSADSDPRASQLPPPVQCNGQDRHGGTGQLSVQDPEGRDGTGRLYGPEMSDVGRRPGS